MKNEQKKLPKRKPWTKFPRRFWEPTGTKVIRDSNGNLKEINLWSSRSVTDQVHRQRAAIAAQLIHGSQNDE